MDVQEIRDLALALTPEVIEFLKLSQNADTSIMPIKGDKLVVQGEAASILHVGKPMITRYVNEGLLSPVYTPHCNRRKFWLSEVKALVSGNLEEVKA